MNIYIYTRAYDIFKYFLKITSILKKYERSYKKNEINLRSVVNMPAGSGKKVSVAVVCEADKQKIAEDAGADIYGGDDFIEKIKNQLIMLNLVLIKF